jgi:hypothetical protein
MIPPMKFQSKRNRLLPCFAAILLPPLTALAAKPADTVYAVLQGQSNAVDMFQSKPKEKGGWFGDAGFYSIFKPMVRDLTGIPNVLAYGDTFTPGQRTLVGGTYTYKTGEATTWMKMEGPDPAAWPLGPLGLECDTYLRNKIRDKVGEAPVALLRIHSEFDSRHDSADAAFYAAANRNFVTRMREAAGLPAPQMPVFYGQVPYSMGVKKSGINALRKAWKEDVADPSFNARYAWGSANDADPHTDGTHTGLEGCRQANARMALAFARWLHDNGYSHLDLSSLPTTGPQITEFRSGPEAHQLEVTIRHDGGTDIVIPTDAYLRGFTIDDPECTGEAPKVVGAERIDPTTLRLTLDKTISSSPAVTLDYLMGGGLNGTGKLITDNYHEVSKPAHIAGAIASYYPALRMPLARLAAPLAIGGHSFAKHPTLEIPLCSVLASP